MSCVSLFSLSIIGKQESLSNDIAKIIEYLEKEKIKYELTAMGTIIETNNLNETFYIIQKSIDYLIEYYKNNNQEIPRISLLIKTDIRKGDNRIQQKIRSVKDKLK